MSKVRQIIEKYIKNAYPKSTQNNFISWLKGSEKQQEIDQVLFDLWNETEVEADASTEYSFYKLQNKISNNNRRNALTRHPFVKRVGRIAAILLLPLLSASVTYFYIAKQEPTNREYDAELVEHFIPNGEIKTITLPDSSQVQLNSGSILIHPKKFADNKREIYLNGEASFTVKRNTSKPFIVKTTDMDVEVLGTVFNVNSYMSDKSATTTLESGKVNVHLKNKKAKSITLNPDEQIQYNRETGDIVLKKVDAQNILSWNKGYLIVQSMTLEDITKLMERKFGVEVSINTSKYVNEKITAKFIRDENINEFMNVIQQLIPGLKYKIDNNTVYIF